MGNELKSYDLYSVTPKWKGEGNSIEADGHEYEKHAKIKQVIEAPATIDAFNNYSHRSCQRYYAVEEPAAPEQEPAKEETKEPLDGE